MSRNCWQASKKPRVQPSLVSVMKLLQTISQACAREVPIQAQRDELTLDFTTYCLTRFPPDVMSRHPVLNVGQALNECLRVLPGGQQTGGADLVQGGCRGVAVG